MLYCDCRHSIPHLWFQAPCWCSACWSACRCCYSLCSATIPSSPTPSLEVSSASQQLQHKLRFCRTFKSFLALLSSLQTSKQFFGKFSLGRLPRAKYRLQFPFIQFPFSPRPAKQSGSSVKSTTSLVIGHGASKVMISSFRPLLSDSSHMLTCPAVSAATHSLVWSVLQLMTSRGTGQTGLTGPPAPSLSPAR